MEFPRLTVIAGPAKGQVLNLVEGSRAVIGRSRSADFPLDSRSVSRHHCLVTYRDGVLELKDLGSTNGTYVNRRRVSRQRLQHGDRIQVGDALIEVHLPRARGSRLGSWLAADRPAIPTPREGLSLSAEEAARVATLSSPSHRALRKLGTLYALLDVLTREDALERAYPRIAQQLLDAIDADRVALLLLHGDEDAEPELVAEARREGQEARRFQVSREVLREVLGRGQAVLSNDAVVDARYQASDSLVAQQVRSLLCVPLTGRKHHLGVIYADSLSRSHAFHREDLELLSAVGQQAGLAIERLQLLKDLDRLFIGTIRTLVAAIEAKDSYTCGHSMRVTLYALATAEAYGLSREQREVLELAGLLHDVGKIGVPEHILTKPGPLEKHEYEIIQRHPQDGANIILNIPHPSIADVARAVRAHHERWDGKGYPDQLRGEEIPLLARILAVADAYDAMTSDRSYRKGFAPQEALRRLRRGSGSQFQPEVVQAFLEAYHRGLKVPEEETTRFFVPRTAVAAGAPDWGPLEFDEDEPTRIIG